jgi:hypothetical protein
VLQCVIASVENASSTSDLVAEGNNNDAHSATSDNSAPAVVSQTVVSDVITISDAHPATAKKSVGKSDLKTSKLLGKLSAADRRPSAPVLSRDVFVKPSARQDRKNSVQPIVQTKSNVATDALRKQTTQNSKAAKSSVDVGRGTTLLGTKNAKPLSEANPGRLLNAHPKTGDGAHSAKSVHVAGSRLQSSAASRSTTGQQVASSDRTLQRSRLKTGELGLSSRTSTPQSGNDVTDGRSRTSDESGASQPGSVSDVSSLDVSHNSSGALSNSMPRSRISTASSGALRLTLHIACDLEVC